MEFEKNIKIKLLMRGFTEKQLLNNRGLISAVIDETILLQTKNLILCEVMHRRELLIDLLNWYEETFDYLPSAPIYYVDEYLKEKGNL